MQNPFDVSGVECGPGWAKLYEPLIEACKINGVTILQVKEKFGHLRFYVGPEGGHQDLWDLIDAAESASYKTCEDCGADAEGTVTTAAVNNWLRTLCTSCRETRQTKVA